MSFARTPTDRSKPARDNYICTNADSTDSSPTNLHRHNRLSAVSLTQKESIKLTAALHDLILHPGQQFHSTTMPMRTRSSQPSPAPATTFISNATTSTSSPTYPPEPTPIPHNPSIADTLPAPSGAKELVVTERVTEDSVYLRKYPDGRVVALSLHSMDGVLFCAGSLDGLWLIHDNYPSSIPLFYIVWDTLRNLT